MREPAPGDTAPPVQLPATGAVEWELQPALDRGPVLLLFFRGSWCFLSRRALSALREKQDELEERGCSIAAISMEPLEKLEELRRRCKLGFPLLSDAKAEAVNDYGVTIERRFDCPLPAVFLIGPDGVIHFRHDGRTGRDWPDWDTIAKRLRVPEELGRS